MPLRPLAAASLAIESRFATLGELRGFITSDTLMFRPSPRKRLKGRCLKGRHQGWTL
jgi:hypothetical protein